MINWILQQNLTRPEVLTRIKTALTVRDETWEEVIIPPFSSSVPPPRNQGFPICYGSTTFILNAYQNSLLRPGIFLNPDRFRVSHYVQTWKDKVLNSDGRLITFGKVSSLKSSHDRWYFVRPDNDGKGFSGRIITYQQLLDWSRAVCPMDLPELNQQTEVWVAPSKAILKEWRLFVVGDEVISASRYAVNGELSESADDLPSAMLDFAHSLIQAHRLHDVYVMDIAQVNTGYKLIECNCFNGTGFYAHDIERVIQSISQFVRSKLQAGSS